ncbi:chord-domain-containing protein [Trametes versicolor FP-101664 SS1]|uniref:chord-domain-containing protein n=1 Tax=Trametes versicolor (strain FP-101664) TaxID=717944 RepID=UPI000462364F|nr:chord-domain-containing protein [Trametes versicolor FP-101664 SS1]EIW60059.1 chord-domain-containing protein [Trametes versicolor FP-101664 SS1]
MVTCTHKGCGKDYSPENNGPESCTYHTGAPVFHEGSKSWSCCSDVNKPVLDFDDFLKIPGCTKGQHTDVAPQVAPKAQPTPQVELKMTSSQGGAETYSSAPVNMPSAAASREATPAPKFEEEEDDLSAPVTVGTTCRHSGCNVEYESDELHRTEGGAAAECTYHPKPPIFHEGSKGYLCCKRRVLEFDEFLKIEGCKKGRHVFVPKQKADPQEEEFTECRIDHYQTPSEVHASVFAKKADADTSTVTIEENQVFLDLYLPAKKRFRKTLNLWGPINPEESSYKFFGTKLELRLKKKDIRSWTLLEKTDRDLGNINFTFGVGGRTGTIGAKELVLDDVNRARP